ncbi:MAG TPA: 2-phospho-L-lactate guanylyltransferase [Chloroflexota bacterium]|jgi:2-phospho-L-lactate guanylyltransferase|nr:2-phospho-L-lactate guanylyltransferase [Chloroflexota bacterium]
MLNTTSMGVATSSAATATTIDRPGDAVWAVVVARVGDGAKSRLQDVLTAEQRGTLALAMLADVLAVCAAAPALAGILAVVDTPAARDRAAASGATAVADPAAASGAGAMNAAVATGIAAAALRGARTVIVLPGDVPLLSVADLDALRAAAGGANEAVVVGTSRDGSGTNALLLRPPHVMAPAFGPPSVERHLALAYAAGAAVTRLEGLGLALDVDTPADLALLLRAVAPARHTAAALTTLRGSLPVSGDFKVSF